MREKTVLKLTFQGCDNWDRPVYATEAGVLVVDVDPRKDRKPDLCTKYNNDFYGEPNDPISDRWDLEFIPDRIVWY